MASIPFQLLQEQEWGGRRREGMDQALQFFDRRVMAIQVGAVAGHTGRCGGRAYR